MHKMNSCHRARKKTMNRRWYFIVVRATTYPDGSPVVKSIGRAIIPHRR